MEKEIHAKGSCNCGSVSFSVTTPIRDVYVCHCSICRKATGSGGIAVCVVPSDSIVYTSGEHLIQLWEKPNHDWLTNFCRTCGSPLPGKNDESRSFIPVSLIDNGGEDLKIKHHIFVDSKASWEEIGNKGKKHKEAFEG